MNMSAETGVAMTLDLKGMVCPIPIVKMSQAIKQVQEGDLIEAFATDPGVLADIPAWCRTSGNEMVTMERADKNFRFIVRRVK